MKIDVKIDMEETGKKIKHLMETEDITVIQVKEFLGLATKQTVYKWFWGKSIPSIESAFALAALFEIKVDDLFVVEVNTIE